MYRVFPIILWTHFEQRMSYKCIVLKLSENQRRGCDGELLWRLHQLLP